MLESIAEDMMIRLAAARGSVMRGREQLAVVLALRWESPAGQAFNRRSGELHLQLLDLDARMGSAQIQLAAARADLLELEAAILAQSAAPVYPFMR
ncbi:hypothetical protein [Paeniglutamicibacter cryotolerans]|uniref:Uncharacterized protein n=1 Tax=Paeniglutamicibacter cryotolerans TaxID=670079 RepID=A0A839QF77_9MICC|nr:hypothetical protein [Paeniglutamicibacter cryotolerans]MBB2994799.1 hypothetical protein [Paeniglutamicibacter cryotolerans]